MAKLRKKSHTAIKYADKHKLSPDKRVNSCRGERVCWGLVEAEAGYVGGLDYVGVIVALF